MKQDKIKTQTNYRVDGGAESYYTTTKKDATREYKEVIENFGEAAIWEIIEEWDDKEGDWELSDENMIKASKNYHTGID